MLNFGPQNLGPRGGQNPLDPHLKRCLVVFSSLSGFTHAQDLRVRYMSHHFMRTSLSVQFVLISMQFSAKNEPNNRCPLCQSFGLLLSSTRPTTSCFYKTSFYVLSPPLNSLMFWQTSNFTTVFFLHPASYFLSKDHQKVNWGHRIAWSLLR